MTIFANRVSTLEEILADKVADENHIALVNIVFVGVKPPLANFDINDVDKIGGTAHDVDTPETLTLVAYAGLVEKSR